MSKLEMVKKMDGADMEHQLETIRTVAQLQETIEALQPLKTMLQSQAQMQTQIDEIRVLFQMLPEAVASKTSEAVNLSQGESLGNNLKMILDQIQSRASSESLTQLLTVTRSGKTITILDLILSRASSQDTKSLSLKMQKIQAMMWAVGSLSVLNLIFLIILWVKK